MFIGDLYQLIVRQRGAHMDESKVNNLIDFEHIFGTKDFVNQGNSFGYFFNHYGQ